MRIPHGIPDKPVRKADMHPHCTRCQVCIHVPVVPFCPLGGGLLAFLFSTESVRKPEMLPEMAEMPHMAGMDQVHGRPWTTGFQPGSVPVFFVCSSPGGRVAIPSGRNRNGAGCSRGHSGFAQTPIAALRNRKRKRKEGRKNEQKQQKHKQQRHQPEYRKTPADKRPDSCGKDSREVPGQGIRLQKGQHRFRYAAL